MKLLIVTQKVDQNDDILGFFLVWLREFARTCEEVTVICLEKGEYSLPGNVRVFSLGKEQGTSKVKYILNFYRDIIRERENYDAVFVHMNPEYVVLGGLIWRLLGKKIGLWYTHKAIDLKLQIAEKFTNYIFTGAEESFLLKTNKVRVVGHGIDVDQYARRGTRKMEDFTILHVGRITSIKNIDILIEAIHRFVMTAGVRVRVLLAGNPMTKEDFLYKEQVVELIKKHHLEDVVVFLGSIPNKDIAPLYQEADISLNLAPTGGIDKAVLESMASGVPVFCSNKAFVKYFGPYAEDLIFTERNPEDLARKIEKFIERTDKKEIEEYLLTSVKEKGGITTLVARFLKILKNNETSR